MTHLEISHMSKILGIQKNLVIFVVSFFLAVVQRTVTRVWPFSRTTDSQRQACGPLAKEGLALRIGNPVRGREGNISHYLLQLTGSFPYVFLEPIPLVSMHLPLISAAYLSVVAESEVFGGGSLPLTASGMFMPGSCPGSPSPGGGPGSPGGGGGPRGPKNDPGFCADGSPTYYDPNCYD